MILNHDLLGNPAKPCVVLMHGLFGSLDNLRGLAKELCDDFCVLLVDLRNHGSSPRAESMALKHMAGDLFDTLDKLDIPVCHILGHSLGGKVAMVAALLHPRRVESLIIADIAPVTYGGSRHDDVFAALRSVDVARLSTRSEALGILRGRLTEPGIAEFLLKSLYKLDSGGFAWRFNVDVLHSEYRHVADWPEIEGSYSGPVRFIKGSESEYITGRSRDAVTALFPKASLRIINGAGHWLHAQKPAAFNRLVIEFLERLDA